MTEAQRDAFGFAGINNLWDETCKVLNALQEQELFVLISRDTKGEDRIHAAGRVDGINLVLSTLDFYRKEAMKLNGLTPLV
jgi:hypothetical protein